MSNYPTSLDTFNNPAGTTLLSDGTALHNIQHSDANDAIEALEAKIGVGAGTPTLNKILVGTGNGTATWGTVWNNATLGTPNVTGGTATNVTLVTPIGLTKTYITVGSAQSDYTTDGTADDVQIQAAIDAAYANGGGVVLIKKGTYEISNNVTPALVSSRTEKSGITIKAGVSLIGEGVGETILNTTSFSGTVNDTRFTTIVNATAGISNISICNLTIQLPDFVAGAGAYWGGGILLQGCSNVLLQNLNIINGNWAFFGNTYAFDSTTKEFTTDSTNILVDNVVNNEYVGSNTLFYVNDSVIRNNKMYGGRDDSLHIAGGGQRILVEGNIIDGQSLVSITGASTAHIYINNDASVSSDDKVLSDIKIINNTLRRYYLGSGQNSGIGLSRCQDIIIDGNLIENCGYGITNSGGNGTRNIIIEKNIIRQNRGEGIRFENAASMYAYNVSVVNNKIYNNGTYPVFFQSGVVGTAIRNLSIIGNQCFDSQGTITQTNGIYVGAVGTSVAIASIIHVANATDGGTAVDKFDNASGGTIVNIVIKSNLGIADS